jgi:hypothetical protein
VANETSKQRARPGRRTDADERADERATAADTAPEAGPGPPDEAPDPVEDLAGDALDKRAAELDIEGRSGMSADEKREAIRQAEAAPPQPEVTPAAPDGSAGPVDTAPQGVPYDKATLLARASQLLGVDPVVARGVLRDAEDPITVEAARARIETFLNEPVVKPNEEE